MADKAHPKRLNLYNLAIKRGVWAPVWAPVWAQIGPCLDLPLVSVGQNMDRKYISNWVLGPGMYKLYTKKLCTEIAQKYNADLKKTWLYLYSMQNKITIHLVIFFKFSVALFM